MKPRFFDWLSTLAGVGDEHWQLIAQAAVAPGATVLEIGTGTGNLLLKVKRAVPDATVIGLVSDATPGGKRTMLPLLPAGVSRRSQHHMRSVRLPATGQALALMKQAELFDCTRVGQGRSRLGQHEFYRAAR